MNDPSSVVLVVDRDPSARRALRGILRRAGYEVETFSSAAAVSAFSDVSSPRCAVVDVRLRDANNLQILAVLAKTCPGIPVVFVSAKGDIRSTVAIMKAGAVDFLVKPFDEQALLDAVNRALAQDGRAKPERLLLADLRKRLGTLTRRQRQVFESVVRGMLNKQIAAQLGTSEKTVKFHRGNVMKKMHAQSVAQLVQIALKLGSPPDVTKPPAPRVGSPRPSPRARARALRKFFWDFRLTGLNGLPHRYSL
jgi:FixJ family two-component response regulator